MLYEVITPASAAGDTQLPAVLVEGQAERVETGKPADVPLERVTATTSDTATLLRAVPGVSVNAAGGVSGLPSIRGLADDRLLVGTEVYFMATGLAPGSPP